MPESRLQSRVWPSWWRFACAISISASWAEAGDGRTWEPAKPRLTTPWTAAVTPGKAHRDYPRPQMVRPEWVNLNGLWEYAICSKEVDRPLSWEGSILVPFPVESALSGVGKTVGPEQALWYRRRFICPCGSVERRWLLHFGAVDWHAKVWLNEHVVCEHRGGYAPFTLDVTDAIVPGGMWDTPRQAP